MTLEEIQVNPEKWELLGNDLCIESILDRFKADGRNVLALLLKRNDVEGVINWGLFRLPQSGAVGPFLCRLMTTTC